MPARRRPASPSATRSRRARHCARLRARRAPIRRRLRGRGGEDRSRRPRRACVLPRADDGAGAEWPLSRKFGCVPAMAIDVLRRARELELDAYGVSSTSDRSRPTCRPGGRALADAKTVFSALAEEGILLKMVNMGGGFPTRYLKDLRRAGLWQGDLRRAARSLRQQHPRDHHRAGPRHGGQCGRDQVGSGAHLAQVRQ